MRFLKIKVFYLCCLCIQLNGCGLFISNASQEFGENLSQALLNHNDPETVASAIPAYLLLLEAMIISEPESESLLTSVSVMYGVYIGFLHDEPSRTKVLSEKSLVRALRSVCIHNPLFCQLNELQYDQFLEKIRLTSADDLGALYTLGTAWALWIQNNKADWNAIAQLAQVKAIMLRITELDSTYKNGNAYAYLGVLETILPPALGGNPEKGKKYFEAALEISKERNLMVKVIFAEQYARMMFDRELHDSLLNSVINAGLEEPRLTLLNTLAKIQAKDLLISADEYF
ncbi:MAG: hypothetical protein HFP81_07650 [Methylococcales symbiont of Hymedesmia sp. n. MRB-2018]|nr:MAG: hypothetical protein HFP78_07895 [Methylococcales symbiont of Hymedesmia sp. n. MRB-2018]KAF3983392.1 MAG: hypothetical protein HFP81_07650 [Methylococcales symbiont of Hymedesmia sp. n. MRB-2018]